MGPEKCLCGKPKTNLSAVPGGSIWECLTCLKQPVVTVKSPGYIGKIDFSLAPCPAHGNRVCRHTGHSMYAKYDYVSCDVCGKITHNYNP